ncbi:MAG: MFS transporter [Chloroflexi bacterium]|nr:MFS transporter [Chloroflexota bacterium]
MSDSTSPPALSPGALLRIPNFRTLFVGQIISDFGDALTQLTVLLYINRVTGGNTQALALLLIALALPTATLGLAAGAFVDRWDRKRVMIISNLLRMVLVMGFLLAAATNQIWLIYPVAFLHSTVGSFFAPPGGPLSPASCRRRGYFRPIRWGRSVPYFSGCWEPRPRVFSWAV